MEPLRGARIQKTLQVSEKIDKLKVYIAGLDLVAYSYGADRNNGSWKEKLIDELQLKKYIKDGRIIFTGLLTYVDYRNLLWRSDLHCYFTRPYVTSWSLFEAVSCGASLAINRNSATEYVCENNTVNWVNLDDIEELTKQIYQCLTQRKLKSVARQDFTLSSSLLKYQEFLNNIVRKKEAK